MCKIQNGLRDCCARLKLRDFAGLQVLTCSATWTSNDEVPLGEVEVEVEVEGETGRSGSVI